ncbi:uncharacterized protein [Triticum aestivum]|uniref:uncharacterized protein isoform X1 n=1 Tax=Triticum aestivum TaxID=4565 RepID=UPI001D0121BD|nr:uncharacterized protein LOC123052956 isoform X1 [Triticum aestivum]
MSIREVQKFWFREVDILQFLGISSSPLLSVASSLVAKINSLCKNSGGQQFLLFVVDGDVCMYTCVLEIGELSGGVCVLLHPLPAALIHTFSTTSRGGDWGTVECDRVCADGPPQRHRPDPALQCTARSSCIDAPGVHVALLPCYPCRPRLCRRSSLLFSGFNKKSPCCHCILSSRDSLGAFYTILLMMPSLDATAMLVVLVLPFTYCSLFYFIEIHRNKLYSVRRFYN